MHLKFKKQKKTVKRKIYITYLPLSISKFKEDNVFEKLYLRARVDNRRPAVRIRTTKGK